MIELKPFKIEDWEYFRKWVANDAELNQFAGQIFTFPVDKEQVRNYLSDLNRKVFRVENESKQAIGIGEIISINNEVAKLARILIGEKSMRGQGIGTELITKLTDYGFAKLKKEKIILNVYTWNIGAIKCYENVGYSQTDKPVIKIKVGNDYWETIEMAITSKK